MNALTRYRQAYDERGGPPPQAPLKVLPPDAPIPDVILYGGSTLPASDASNIPHEILFGEPEPLPPPDVEMGATD
jgi:hypothetical protein